MKRRLVARTVRLRRRRVSSCCEIGGKQILRADPQGGREPFDCVDARSQLPIAKALHLAEGALNLLGERSIALGDGFHFGELTIPQRNNILRQHSPNKGRRPLAFRFPCIGHSLRG